MDIGPKNVRRWKRCKLGHPSTLIRAHRFRTTRRVMRIAYHPRNERSSSQLHRVARLGAHRNALYDSGKPAGVSLPFWAARVAAGTV
jgi:hypothetical protein